MRERRQQRRRRGAAPFAITATPHATAASSRADSRGIVASIAQASVALDILHTCFASQAVPMCFAAEATRRVEKRPD